MDVTMAFWLARHTFAPASCAAPAASVSGKRRYYHTQQLSALLAAATRARWHCYCQQQQALEPQSVSEARELVHGHSSHISDSSGAMRSRKQQKPVQTTVLQASPAAAAGMLPDVLAATFPITFPTLSAARRVIRRDLVLVGGAIGNCKTEVAAGQLIQQLEAVSKHKAPRTVSLEVVYEDDHLAVVHKPWGVKMYAGDGRRTITGALRAGALQLSQQPDALSEPKPVHRIDAAVGGLLVIAKTTSAVATLSVQFQGRRVHKVYHALLSGRLEPGTAVTAQWQQQRQQQRQQPMQADHSKQQQQQQDVKQLGNHPEQQLEQWQQLQQQLGRTKQVPASVKQESTSEDEGEFDSSTGLQQQRVSQPELSLPELLQVQLQGQSPFSVTAADIADSHLDSLTTAATQGSVSNTASTSQAIALAASSSSNSSSNSMLTLSSVSGSSSSIAGLGAGVHVVDLPLEGKPCYTLYQVLGYSRCARFGGWMTTVALSPVTGRKHQLRQHMAALGHPVVGDGRYTDNKADHISNQGIYLESLEVCFKHPATQQRMHSTKAEPQRFRTLREQQHRRWRKAEAAEISAAA